MRIVSLDPGFGDVKVCLHEEGEKDLFSFPSLVAEFTPTPFSDEAILRVRHGSRTYVVGEDARTEPACREPYDFTDLVEMLPVYLKYVFLRRGWDSCDLLIASIAPAYWEERARLEKALPELESKMVVVLQGLGGYWKARELLPEGAEYVLVLDLGYNTVDWLLVKRAGDGDDFRVMKGSTIPRLGVTKLVEFFTGELRGDLKELSPRTLREFLRKGEGRIYGERIRLDGAKRRAEERYADTLSSALKQAVGEITRSVDAVVGVGGGTHYFDVRRLGHRAVVIPEAPETANVTGQLEWMLDQELREVNA